LKKNSAHCEFLKSLFDLCCDLIKIFYILFNNKINVSLKNSYFPSRKRRYDYFAHNRPRKCNRECRFLFWHKPSSPTDPYFRMFSDIPDLQYTHYIPPVLRIPWEKTRQNPDYLDSEIKTFYIITFKRKKNLQFSYNRDITLFELLSINLQDIF